MAAKMNKDSIPDGYVLVKSATAVSSNTKVIESTVKGTAKVDPDSKEGLFFNEKVQIGLAPGGRIKEILKMHRSSGKMSDPIQAKLVGSFFLTSAANTALTSVQALSPVSVTDMSYFCSVFDLWRCKKVTVRCRLTGSAAPTGAGNWGWSIDPSNIGAYSSIDDIMTSKWHKAPMVYGTNIVYPGVYNQTGYYMLSAEIPQQRVTNDGTAVNAVGGGWVGTSDTTAVVAWLKPYVGSFGIGNTSTIECYVTYEVEFKSRT